MNYSKRCFATINLDNLKHNYNYFKNLLPTTAKICGVVKADAYGHGDIVIANTLSKLGVDFFAVSNIEEAIKLRNNGIICDILILGPTCPFDASLLVKYDIIQSVSSLEHAKLLNDNLTSPIRVHFKVDTGMNRTGFKTSHEIILASRLENLIPDGIFTHFAKSDISYEYTKLQYDRFMKIIDETGLSFRIRHCSNSAAVLLYPEFSLDMVRIGVAMYGLSPIENKEFDLKPLLELFSSVVFVKEVEENEGISYCHTYTTSKKSKIATLSIGYADGYPRVLSNKGEVLINGKRAKIVGNICMDMLMVDVTHIPNVHIGDLATIIGKNGDENIAIESISKMTNTINYETACHIGKRVTRVYIENDNVCSVSTYVDK